ncbi:MAG: hypothetical protein FWD64_05340 [Acidobacteriaceae bacterium]|nr:hypothetical protein [Acidobacteriaceae bacterium]
MNRFSVRRRGACVVCSQEYLQAPLTKYGEEIRENISKWGFRTDPAFLINLVCFEGEQHMADPPIPGGGSIASLAYFANALVSAYNGYAQRKLQREEGAENRQLTRQLETDRQNFQIDLFYKNAQLQQRLVDRHHELALLEIQENFDNTCKTIEWQLFLQKWPLLVLPSVLRSKQILPDHTTCLRVLFLHSNDMTSGTNIYPRVEQGLKEFVDDYANEFSSKHILFEHNAFTSPVYGGALETNIYHALKDLPVVIISANVVDDEINLSLKMWGLGDNQPKQATVFKMPYERKTVNGKPDMEYCRAIADQMLSYLKFILGYVYDAYNLIQYDQGPLLPSVARFELAQGRKGCVLQMPNIDEEIRAKYTEMFSLLSVLSSVNENKRIVQPYTQLRFAVAMKEQILTGSYFSMLHESLRAWTALRSDQDALPFLTLLANDPNLVPRYCSTADEQYLQELSFEMGTCEVESALTYVDSIGKILHHFKELTAVSVSSQPEISGPTVFDL